MTFRFVNETENVHKQREAGGQTFVTLECWRNVSLGKERERDDIGEKGYLGERFEKAGCNLEKERKRNLYREK